MNFDYMKELKLKTSFNRSALKELIFFRNMLQTKNKREKHRKTIESLAGLIVVTGFSDTVLLKTGN